jgi:O-antigen ligase
VVSAIIIVLGNWGTITSGRLSFSWREENMFQLLGVAFYPIGSNGLAMICCISIAFSAYFVAKKSKNRRVYLLADLFLLIIILLTGSRKGILLFLLVLIIISYCFYTGTKRLKSFLLVIILMLMIFYSIKTIPALYNIIGERFFELLNVFLLNNTTDASYLTRSTLIEHALIYFESRPIIGYGLDSFRIMSGRGICIDNNYLEILVSSGIVGFLIYYSYIPITIYQCRKLKNKTSILKAMLLIMISLLVFHMGSVTYYLRSEWIFLTILFSQIKKDYIKNNEKVISVETEL